jgi:hypothetical protein
MSISACPWHLFPPPGSLSQSDNFLQRIVTGDETWVHHYQPQTKWKSMQWKHLSSPVAKEFKMQPSSCKLMLTMFWDSQGPILETYLEHGTTVTGATYCDMLQRAEACNLL